MVERLGTIMCYVSDMSRAVAFYRDACSLLLQVESPGWSQFDLGNGAAIGLHLLQEGSEERARPAGGWTVGFDTANLTAVKERLEAAGGTAGEFHEVPDGVILDFADPDGNPLSAFQSGITLSEVH